MTALPPPSIERRAVLLVYTTALTYQTTLGMVQVLVPLYALHLGYDLAQLGLIVASHAVLALGVRPFGGAIADQFGERWVLWFSFTAMAVGSLVIMASGAFWALIAGQVLMGFSRAAYWTAVQSYASRINAERSGEVLGRTNGAGAAGMLIGTLAGGLLAGTVGYGFAFGASAMTAVVGLAGSLGLPDVPRPPAARGLLHALAPLPAMLRHRGMAMGGIAAFYASMSVSTGIVLVIPFLKDAGYDEVGVGAMRTVTAVGSVAVGIVFGWLLARTGQRAMYAFGYGLLGLAMLAVPATGGAAWALAPLMLWLGLNHGMVGILYPVTAAQHSAPERRGVAMAYVGIFWGIGQLVVPAGFGALAAAVGLTTSFWVAGGLFLAGGLAMPVVYPRLTAGIAPAGAAAPR